MKERGRKEVGNYTGKNWAMRIVRGGQRRGKEVDNKEGNFATKKVGSENCKEVGSDEGI